MRGLLIAAALFLISLDSAAAAPRVVSLDPCADQYVLALSPRAAIAGLSFRSEAGDSYLRAEAHGLPKRRATLETLLAVQPRVVVREWGGDPALLRRLETNGVKVVSLNDATDFAGVRANVRTAAAALGAPERGEALIADMNRKLIEAGSNPTNRTVAYLTPGGATAGPGTLVDAMLTAAGLKNTRDAPGYGVLSPERLAFAPPEVLVLGFFDAFALGRSWWGPERSGVLKTAAKQRTLASLPGAVLACPAWFTADGALTLSKAARS